MTAKQINAKLHSLEFTVKLAKKELREVKPETMHELTTLRFLASKVR